MGWVVVRSRATRPRARRPPMKAEKWLPCPWGGVLGTHGPNVFIEKRPCKTGGAFCLDCGMCEQRTFGRGRFFARAGFTQNELPPGAVDGRGRAI